MSPDLHHLSGAYSVDALESDERSAFERHLAECTACQSDVAELTAAAHSLAGLHDATPPESLRASVLSGIAQVRPLPPPADDEAAAAPADAASEGATVIPLFRRTTTWIAAAAAAAVLAVGGVALDTWSADQPTLTAIQQVQAAQDAATVTSRKGEFTATLAYSRALDRSALTVVGMPPAPEGKTYQLWYVGSDEIARSAGFLTAADDGRAEAVLQGSLQNAAAVGVTVEPAGGSPSPTTDPIMVMAVA